MESTKFKDGDRYFRLTKILAEGHKVLRRYLILINNNLGFLVLINNSNLLRDKIC